MKNKSKKQEKKQAVRKADVSSSATRPPLGLIPKKIHDERVKMERFNEVCGAISRYYNAGLKINIEWIEEYNELVECVGKYYR
jgi:hypothetical protein